MSKPEQNYDLLDVLRVIKSIWIFALLIPLVTSACVAAWAYSRLQDVSFPSRAQAVIRFPSDAFPIGVAESLLRLKHPAAGDEGTSYSVDIEELAGQFAPTYRTVKVTADTKSEGESQALIALAITQLSEAVATYDDQIQQQLESAQEQRALLQRYLALIGTVTIPDYPTPTAVAEANAAASVVSALGNLDLRLLDLAELGRGPVEIVSPAMATDVNTISSWVRYPIVAALGSLLAVLFVAFTIDGLRIAASQRQRPE